jgi:antitoxin (DNA-binding transcriptional repressor) of toxin-antitoxin stability system
MTRLAMRSINIAELKSRLSTYLAYAKSGGVIVIRDRNLPVAKLIPFTGEQASEEESALVAAGAMRLPEDPLDLDQLWKMPRATVRGIAAVIRSIHLTVNIGGIPHLAKNERDMGHPVLVGEASQGLNSRGVRW